MKFVGILGIFVCTWGGLLIAMGFDMKGFMKLLTLVLTALPGEFTIIMGCAFSAFIIANTSDGIKMVFKYFSALSKPAAYSKDDYIEMLSMLFTVFKLARTKGWLALEAHIENPDESDLFGQFPTFQHNHHASVFLCDYLRIISLGNENPFELEALMDQEIVGIEHHEGHAGHAVQAMADGVPALGIVAAVLGVIKTMSSISEPPEVLGKMIGGALVGTFLGVWLAYGIIGPIAGAMATRGETEVMYYKVIKAGMIAFLNGAAPQVAVEFARKLLPHDVQPSFTELEEKLNELPAPG